MKEGEIVGFGFNIARQKNYNVLYLKGRFIGKEAEDFLAEVEKTLAQSLTQQLVIDLSGLEYIGSQGIAALTGLSTKYQIILAGASPKVKGILDMLKLDQIFKVYPTLQTALQQPTPKASPAGEPRPNGGGLPPAEGEARLWRLA
jgi:anti-anti-sigma factor